MPSLERARFAVLTLAWASLLGCPVINDGNESVVGRHPKPSQPAAEVCDNGVDDNNDGHVDEGCACAVGSQQRCFVGNPDQAGKGPCAWGLQSCDGDGELATWGPCTGYGMGEICQSRKGGNNTGSKAPDASDRDAALSSRDAMSPSGCGCFTHGSWGIQNTAPCVVPLGVKNLNDLSTWSFAAFSSDTTRGCTGVSPLVPPANWNVSREWSANRVVVGCAGEFELCYTIRAGDPDNPKSAPPPAGDCVVARSCTTAHYTTPRALQNLAPLPGWKTVTAEQQACMKQFALYGGYGEMSVRGNAASCGALDDGKGNPLVFNIVPYCPFICSKDPSGHYVFPNHPTSCDRCVINGTSGNF